MVLFRLKVNMYEIEVNKMAAIQMAKSFMSRRVLKIAYRYRVLEVADAQKNDILGDGGQLPE